MRHFFPKQKKCFSKKDAVQKNQGFNLSKIIVFFKKELMLSVALIAALASLFITPPSSALFFEIDWKTLATLFMLLSVLEGFKQENIFNPLLRKTGRISKLKNLTCFFVYGVFFFVDVCHKRCFAHNFCSSDDYNVQSLRKRKIYFERSCF